MTRQHYKTPKARYTVKLTTENYDYLCLSAMRRDVTMARLLNEILESSRNTDIRSCKSDRPNPIIREEQYAR